MPTPATNRFQKLVHQNFLSTRVPALKILVDLKSCDSISSRLNHFDLGQRPGWILPCPGLGRPGQGKIQVDKIADLYTTARKAQVEFAWAD